MKIIHVLILAAIQVAVIPVVAALSSSHYTPAPIRFVRSENMTTIYETPGTGLYHPRALNTAASSTAMLEM